jgi:hypothetical protein
MCCWPCIRQTDRVSGLRFGPVRVLLLNGLNRGLENCFMRNSVVVSVAATVFLLGVALVTSRAAAESEPAYSGPSSRPISKTIVPVTGVESVAALNAASGASTGPNPNTVIVEAVPTPSAFQGGIVVLGVLALFRLYRKLKQA